MSRKVTSSKHDYTLRILAPRRFGFHDIETVRCFICNREQERIPVPGREKGHRIVDGHHIYPVSIYPELEKEPDNYIFLCDKHHHEFHSTYDLRIRKEDKQMYIITASYDELQLYLNLTATYTVAKQQKWTQEEMKDLVKPYKMKYKPRKK